MPVRIYDIAKKLGVDNKFVLAKAKELDIEGARVASSLLSDHDATRIEQALRPDTPRAKNRSLSSFQLGNFKAFAQTQSLPVRPLTLLFGANSSGKSSIVHGLLLAHHALATGELDASTTLLGGDAVDLGGFRQYVHRRNTDAFVDLAIELSTVPEFTQAPSTAPNLGEKLRLELRWGAPAFEEDEHGQPISRSPLVRACDFLMGSRPILRFFRQADGRFRIKELGTEAFAAGVRALIETSTTVLHPSAEDLALATRALAEFAAQLQFDGQACLPGAPLLESIPAPGAWPSLQPVGRSMRDQDLASAFRLFAPRLITDTLDKLTLAFKGELQRLAYLGPLRSFPPRHLPFGEIRDTNWVAGGGKAWETLRRDEGVRNRVNQWLSDPERLSTPFQVSLRRHVASSDLEPLLADEFERIQAADVGPDPTQGDFKMIVNRRFTPPKELVRKLEVGEISRADYDKTLREMVSKDQIEVSEQKVEFQSFDVDPEKAAAGALKRIHQELETIDDLALLDKRTGTIVTHRDVGIGISQVLPVLVHAYGDKGKIIAIEQPEIHLHPALQAELGDVFIESALGERNNTFVLETHSEHLILRILRRVRETTEKALPKGATPVRPDDISVVFVEPTSKGSVIKHLPVTQDGDFAEPWPGGFFADRLADLP
jgi:hypothetical protein